MAEAGSSRGEALIWRLRRLMAQAEAPDLAGNRARLLTLADDIRDVQRSLARECERLSNEMKQAAARANAATAYARCARSTQIMPYRGMQQSNGASS